MNEYCFEVKWSETDAAGIVFYPNFYKWMNDAAHNILAKIGYPISRLIKEEKIGIPLLEAKCEFKSPLLVDDKVTVCTSVREVRNKVVILDHVFVKDGVEVARGYEIRAWTDFKEEPKAVSIPQHIRVALDSI